MGRSKIFEPIGYGIALFSFVFSLIFFYRDNAAFMGSFAAALMAAGLFWVSYIILRIFILAFKDPY